MKKLSLNELGRLSTAQYLEVPKLPLIIVLDNVRSQNNIGSIFRTSDAFRVQEIHLCGITACPPSAEMHKTALGATDSVTWKYFADTAESLKYLQDSGYYIYGAEQTTGSISLHDTRFNLRRSALVLGNEVNGISDQVLDMIDQFIEVPQFGTKHSINVSVCAGICIWEISKQMTANFTFGFNGLQAY